MQKTEHHDFGIWGPRTHQGQWGDDLNKVWLTLNHKITPALSFANFWLNKNTEWNKSYHKAIINGNDRSPLVANASSSIQPIESQDIAMSTLPMVPVCTETLKIFEKMAELTAS